MFIDVAKLIKEGPFLIYKIDKKNTKVFSLKQIKLY